MTNKEYWSKVRYIAAEFDPEAYKRDKEEEDPSERNHLRRSQVGVWLISLTDDATGSVAGMVVEARPYLAAERIFAKTHRLATAAEIEQEQVRRATEKTRIEGEAEKAKGNHSKDIAEEIATATKEMGVTLAHAIGEAMANQNQGANQKPARTARAEQPST